MRPRVNPSIVDLNVLNEFLSKLYSLPQPSLTGPSERRLKIVIGYEDGTSETIFSLNYEASDKYFAFTIVKPQPFEKNVTQLTINFQIRRSTIIDYDKTFMVFDFDESTGTFVYNVGDNMSFKIVIETNYMVQ